VKKRRQRKRKRRVKRTKFPFDVTKKGWFSFHLRAAMSDLQYSKVRNTAPLTTSARISAGVYLKQTFSGKISSFFFAFAYALQNTCIPSSL
jgi:hypothetical protein